MIAVGQTYVNGRAAGVVRAEWLPAQFTGSPIAPTLFVKSVIGANNNSSVIGGLKIYFGNHDKTLIRRHREDDPEIEQEPAVYANPQTQLIQQENQWLWWCNNAITNK